MREIATINNQYKDKDNDNEKITTRTTSDDKEDDQGREGGHVCKTKLMTASEDTGYATIITYHGMTTTAMTRDATKTRYNYVGLHQFINY